MDSMTELFCQIDDFCRAFEPAWERRLLAAGVKKRKRNPKLSPSELMTLAALFHQLRFRLFKGSYLFYACRHLRREFPRLPSYQRCAAPLAALFGMLKGKAARGKTSMGWFFGFKLHLTANSKGELLSVRLTPGNTDDRKPTPEMCGRLFGKLFGDRGHVSKDLTKMLEEQGAVLIAALKKNMKPVPRTDFEKAVLRRRSLVETVIDELRNLCQIEHARHRSVANFLVGLMAGIVAYCLADDRPSLNLIRTNTLLKA